MVDLGAAVAEKEIQRVVGPRAVCAKVQKRIGIDARTLRIDVPVGLAGSLTLDPHQDGIGARP